MYIAKHLFSQPKFSRFFSAAKIKASQLLRFLQYCKYIYFRELAHFYYFRDINFREFESKNFRIS